MTHCEDGRGVGGWGIVQTEQQWRHEQGSLGVPRNRLICSRRTNMTKVHLSFFWSTCGNSFAARMGTFQCPDIYDTQGDIKRLRPPARESRISYLKPGQDASQDLSGYFCTLRLIEIHFTSTLSVNVSSSCI